jgi:hypothetical protein
MPISNLTPLTQQQYQALNITRFRDNPTVTSSGNPDPDAQITLGGWVGTDTIAFIVNDNPGSQSRLTIESITTNTIGLNVTDNTNPASMMTYYTINLGANAINSNWELSFDVAANNSNTGKWKFVKGKSTFDVKGI